MNEFIINKKLPSLNDIIRWNRAGAYVGARHKKEIDELIGHSIRKAVKSGTLHKPKGAVIISIEWTEADKRRDADNIIAGGTKFICDALVDNKVLIDDNRRFVKGFYHKIVDGKEYKIKVELIDIKERV